MQSETRCFAGGLRRETALKNLFAIRLAESAAIIAYRQAHHGTTFHQFVGGIDVDAAILLLAPLDGLVGIQHQVADHLQQADAVRPDPITGHDRRQRYVDRRLCVPGNHVRCLAQYAVDGDVFRHRRHVRKSLLVRQDAFDLPRLCRDDTQFVQGFLARLSNMAE